MEMMLWNVVLSVLFGVLAYIMNEKFKEVQRLGVLLNRTREEVARDHITRTEFRADMQQLMDRFDRIEQKLDKLAGRHRTEGL
jgi:archaellum component FlaC